MVVDQVPIRSAAMREYLKSEKQIAKAREQLEAFESGDLPAYTRWEAQTFGSELSALREIATAAEAKREILVKITNEIFFTGCDEVTAYRRVMQLDPPAGEPPPPGAREDWDEEEQDQGIPKVFGDSDLPEDFDIDEYDRWSRKRRESFREMYEEEAELYAIFEGREAPGFDEVIERERRRRHGEPEPEAHPNRHAPPPEPRREFPPSPSLPPNIAGRVKELYRTLVRQLHPDMAGEQTDRERELWHQLQEAYRTHDLEWMEAIAGRLEFATQGAAKLPLQTLRRMIRELVLALQGLRHQVSQRRKHPAWEFRKKTAQLPRLAELRRRDLQQRRKILLEELTDMDRILQALAEQADRVRVPRKKKSQQRGYEQPEQGMFSF